MINNNYEMNGKKRVTTFLWRVNVLAVTVVVLEIDEVMMPPISRKRSRKSGRILLFYNGNTLSLTIEFLSRSYHSTIRI